MNIKTNARDILVSGISLLQQGGQIATEVAAQFREAVDELTLKTKPPITPIEDVALLGSHQSAIIHHYPLVSGDLYRISKDPLLAAIARDAARYRLIRTYMPVATALGLPTARGASDAELSTEMDYQLDWGLTAEQLKKDKGL